VGVTIATCDIPGVTIAATMFVQYLSDVVNNVP
jgi:hypothetical protein